MLIRCGALKMQDLTLTDHKGRIGGNDRPTAGPDIGVLD